MLCSHPPQYDVFTSAACLIEQLAQVTMGSRTRHFGPHWKNTSPAAASQRRYAVSQSVAAQSVWVLVLSVGCLCATLMDYALRPFKHSNWAVSRWLSLFCSLSAPLRDAHCDFVMLIVTMQTRKLVATVKARHDRNIESLSLDQMDRMAAAILAL